MEQEYEMFTNDTINHEDRISNEMQLSSNISIVFYVMQCLLFLPDLYVNTLVLRMAMREAVILSLELKLNSIFNMTSSIYNLVFMGTIHFASPASSKIGTWYCHVSSVILTLEMWRVSVLTTSVAVYRYIFIIYREKAKCSKKREKRVIWVILMTKWFLLSVFTAKFIIFNGNYIAVNFWNAVCYGMMPGSTPAENSTSTMTEYFNERFFYLVTKDNSELITIFGTMENGVASLFLKVFCIIVDMLIVVSCLNISEGVIYYRIAKYMKM